MLAMDLYLSCTDPSISPAWHCILQHIYWTLGLQKQVSEAWISNNIVQYDIITYPYIIYQLDTHALDPGTKVLLLFHHSPDGTFRDSPHETSHIWDDACHVCVDNFSSLFHYPMAEVGIQYGAISAAWKYQSLYWWIHYIVYKCSAKYSTVIYQIRYAHGLLCIAVVVLVSW